MYKESGMKVYVTSNAIVLTLAVFMFSAIPAFAASSTEVAPSKDGQTIELHCDGRKTFGDLPEPDRFDVIFTDSSSPTLAHLTPRTQSDNGSRTYDEFTYPNGPGFSLWSDASLIIFCRGGETRKTCTEIDRRTGSFESLYYFTRDGDRKSKAISRGTCEPKRSSQNNKF